MLKKFLEKKYNKHLMKPEKFYSCLFKVKGINPNTKRKKTIEVVAASNAPKEVITSKSGLLPPFDVSIAVEPPSPEQLALAKKYKVTIPSDADSMDARLLLQRYFDNTPPTPPISRSIVEYAIRNNVYIPKYAGISEAKDFLLEMLPEKEKEITKLK